MKDGDRRKLDVRSVHVIFAALFAVITIAFLLDGNVDGNELDTFALAKARMDPSYLPHDWRMGLEPGARLPFQLLLSPLLRVFSFEVTSIVGRLALYAILALGLARLAVRLDLDAFGALAVAGLYGYLDQHLCAGEFLVTGLESKSLAYALAILALDALLGRRLVWSAAFIGAAITFHPLVGGWCFVALGAAALSMRIRPARKELLMSALALTLIAAPGAWFVLASLRSHADPEGVRLYVYFRHPHHLDPAWFLGRHREPKIRAAVAVLSALGLFFVKFATPQVRAIARFAQATIGVFCMGLLASLLPHAERVLSTYPFRVGDTLFPLFLLALLVAFARTKLSARAKRLVMPASAIAVTAFAVRAALIDTTRTREREQEPVRTAYAWLRTNTTKDARVLASPALPYAGLFMERPTVASCKAVPTSPSDVVEWKRRIDDLDGHVPLAERGFPAFEEIDHGFEHLSDDAIDALVDEYHARYVLVRHGRALRYPKVFDTDDWTIYATP